MVTCQSANQLKTPAKVSWAFKMVSQFGSLGYTIMGKTADLTVVQKTIIDTLHKEGKPQTFIAKEAVHRVLYPSMLTESWVEGKGVGLQIADCCKCCKVIQLQLCCWVLKQVWFLFFFLITLYFQQFLCPLFSNVDEWLHIDVSTHH